MNAIGSHVYRRKTEPDNSYRGRKKTVGFRSQKKKQVNVGDIMLKLKESWERQSPFSNRHQSWNSTMRGYEIFNINPRYVEERENQQQQQLHQQEKPKVKISHNDNQNYLNSRNYLKSNVNHLARNDSNMNFKGPKIEPTPIPKIDPIFESKPMVKVNQNHLSQYESK